MLKTLKNSLDMRRYFITILLQAIGVAVVGQSSFKVRFYNLTDGLPSNTISSIFQTPDELMWFSSWNGLTCYDGYSFVTYNDPPSAHRTLTTNRFIKVSPTKKGYLWCITHDLNVFRFDRTTCRFTNVTTMVREHAGSSLFRCGRVITLPNGHVWLLTRNSQEDGRAIFRVDEEQPLEAARLEMFTPDDGTLKGAQVYNVGLDAEGDEWVLTDGGPTRVGGQVACRVPYKRMTQVGKYTFFASDDGQLGYYAKGERDVRAVSMPSGVTHISLIAQTNELMLAIATNLGTLLLDARTMKLQQLDMPELGVPQHFYTDSHKRLWAIAAHGGVALIDPASGHYQRLATDHRATALPQSNRNLIHEDLYGTVWVATDNGFFGYYDQQQQRLVSVVLRSQASQPAIDRWYADQRGNLWIAGEHDLGLVTFSLPLFTRHHVAGMSQVRSLCFDAAGRLWVGDQEGHVAVIAADGQTSGYLGGDGRLHPGQQQFTHHVYCIYADSRHRLWLGTKGDGIYCLEADGRLRHYMHQTDDKWSLPSDQVYTILEDRQHRIWVGTFQQGICLLHEQPDGGIRFIHRGNELHGYPTSEFNRVRRLAETQDGIILVACSNGLLTFSEQFGKPEDIRFHASSSVPGDTTSLLTNDVMQAYVNHQNQVFVLTLGGGVQYISNRDLLHGPLHFSLIPQYYQNLGTIYSLIQDRQDNYWTAFENTLTMYEKKTNELWLFGPAQLGDRIELTEALPAYNKATGQMVYATTSGYISFLPDQIAEQTTTPPLLFTGVRFHGTHQQASLTGNYLHVDANQRNMTLYFSALDYHDNYLIRYAYRLEGTDRDWNDLGTSHSISFSDLPHGRHRLLIRSTNRHGAWTDNVQTLTLDVEPTFWESVWGKLLYALLLMGVVAVAVWIYRLHLRNSMERQLNTMKTNFFTDISHKLRTPLTLIGGPVRQVLDSTSLTQAARQSLEMVERNARLMLQLVNSMLEYGDKPHTYISDENIVSSPPELSNIQDNLSPNLRLLIVEDNNDLRTYLAGILASDYQVMQAANGQEGLDTACREQPDFILTDVMMPVMDGLEMVRRIKQNPDVCHIPIVVLSAKASLDDRLQGLREGVNDYITKPFSATYLKQRMRNIIDNQRMLQQSLLEQIKPATPEGDGQSIRLKTTNIVDSDRQMLDRLLAYIDENMGNPELVIEDLASAVCLGRTVFYNKVKTMTGTSPVELLRHLRIQRAEDMIAQTSEPFSQIAYAVGFSDPKYFGKCFKKQTGLTPSEYREQRSHLAD